MNDNKSDIDDIIKVLECTISGDECRFDHHGYCQEHGWLSSGECFVATAKRVHRDLTGDKLRESLSLIDHFFEYHRHGDNDQYTDAWKHLRSFLSPKENEHA